MVQDSYLNNQKIQYIERYKLQYLANRINKVSCSHYSKTTETSSRLVASCLLNPNWTEVLRKAAIC